MSLHVRWMVRRDMPEVLDVERESFADAWGEDGFHRLLRRRNTIGMVAEQGEWVVGYMLYELHADRIELLRIAVAADRRREGVGEVLLNKLKGKVAPFHRSREAVSIDVPEPEATLEACRFLASQGFASRLVRGRVEGPDAYRFRFAHLDEAALLGAGEGSCSKRR